MKSRRLIFAAATTFGLMAISLQLAAQEPHATHHHYKLIDLGTFGGPQSYVNGFEYHGAVQNLNNAGTLAGWADTSELDPFQNFCFSYEGTPCYVSRAFQWQDGVRSELSALQSGLSSATAWISANGLIAGASQNGETDPLLPGYPQNRAVLWRNGKIIDLGTLPEGGYESGAQGVNSRGQVVGWALNTVSDPYSMALFSSIFNFYEPVYPYQERAFLWQDGVMQDLGTLGTGTDAYAMAINERGQVIGISYTNSIPNSVMTPCVFQGSGGLIPTQDPFLWDKPSGMIDLGTLGGTCGAPAWINNHGQVVGFSDLAGDQTSHAFLWTKQDRMQDLGTLGGSFSAANMINNSGLVVGQSTLPGDKQGDAFLWNGTMHDLGAINGCAAALAINAHEQVVGNWGGSQCTQGAFLWQKGGPMVDLSSLVSPPTNLTLGVISINDHGEIAGSGDNANNIGHAILLIPCDENHPGVEGCDYSLVDSSVAGSVSSVPVAPRSTTTNRSSPVGRMLRQR